MAPAGYNSSGYSSTGLSSRNNGFGRVGGSFQNNRGSLTKLSGGNTRASSIGGSSASLSNVAARNVPKPINTSSLRKENGGQDISTVLVNRQVGKVGWGSSLYSKTDGSSPIHGEAPSDPTTDGAIIENNNATDYSKKEISTNTSPSNVNLENNHQSSPSRGSSKSTPWSIHSSTTHEHETDYHPIRKDDTPHLQEEPIDEYDRSIYKVDRYSRVSYDREIGSRSYRYDQNGHRDEMYHPTNSSFRRNSQLEEADHNDRGSKDFSMRYSRPEQWSYDRGYNRVYNRTISSNDADPRVHDRSSTHGLYYPPRPETHGRTTEHSSAYKSDVETYGMRQETHWDNRTSGYSRGSNDEFSPRYSRYDHPHRDSSAGHSYQRNGYRTHTEFDKPSRKQDNDAPNRLRGLGHFDRDSDFAHSEKFHQNGTKIDEKYTDNNLSSKQDTPNVSNDEPPTSVVNAPVLVPREDYGITHTDGNNLIRMEETPYSDPRPIPDNKSDLHAQKDLKQHGTGVVQAYSGGQGMVNDGNREEDESSKAVDKKSANDENTDHYSREEVSNTEQQRLYQQQMVLQRVQVVRDMKKKASVDDSKGNHKKSQPHNIQTGLKNLVEDDHAESADISEKEKSKAAYLAKREAERVARMEHRLNRRPRTQGVLYKRLDDGTIVNADLLGSDRTKRQHGKNKKVRNSRPTDEEPKGKVVKAATNNSEVPTVSTANKTVEKINSNDEKNSQLIDSIRRSEKRVRKTNRDTKIVMSETSAIEKTKEGQRSDDNQVHEENTVLSNAPSSAWLAGPPPSMFKNQRPNESDNDLTSKTTIEQQNETLSSKLLSSWSSKNDTDGSVAKGPILSTWSSMSRIDVGLFQPFHSSKQESTPTADWNMDFALPRDLLSPTIDDHEVPSSQTVHEDKVIGPSSKSEGRRFRARGSKTKPQLTTASQSKESGYMPKSRNRRITKVTSISQPTESEIQPKITTHRRMSFRSKKSKTETQ